MRGASARAELDSLVDGEKACEAHLLRETDLETRAGLTNLGDYPIARIYRAKLRREVGDVLGAIDDVTSALQLEGDADDDRLELAELYESAGKQEVARREYEHLLKHGSPKERQAAESGLKRILQ